MSDITIEASEVLRVEVSDDGARVKFRLLDAAGREVGLVLPASRLGELLAAIPNALSPTHPASKVRPPARPVSAWSLSSGDGARDLALTLVTEEGRVACFGLTDGQVAGIATVWQFGHPAPERRRVLN